MSAIIDPIAADPTEQCGAEPLCLNDVIRRHHHALVRFLRRLGALEDTLDVAQETYIRMMKYEGSRAVSSPRSLLFRIAANLVADSGRAAQARRSRDHVELENAEAAIELPSAEREASARQELEILAAAVAALPPRCREVFLLSRVDGLTYPEIAVRCGISVKMVEKHISRALEACIAKLGGRVSPRRFV